MSVLNMGPRLTRAPFTGRPLRSMSTRQLETARDAIANELEAVVARNDDEACIACNRDIQAIDLERRRRWECFIGP